MPVPALTATELCSQLAKTAIPTVLIEGADDVAIFRRIQSRLGFGGIQFFSAGSRSILLQVFEWMQSTGNQKVAFFADRDLWYFDGIPQEYIDVVFTFGYSIENDLYVDGKRQMDRLLEPHELPFLQDLLHHVCQWFSFEVDLRNSASTPEYAKHSILNPNVIAKQQNTFSKTFLDNRSYVAPKDEDVAAIKQDDFSGLQGKLIFDCYHKVFNDLREKDQVRFAHSHLHEICLAEGADPANPESRINQTIAKLQEKLAPHLPRK